MKNLLFNFFLHKIVNKQRGIILIVSGVLNEYLYLFGLIYNKSKLKLIEQKNIGIGP